MANNLANTQIMRWLERCSRAVRQRLFRRACNKPIKFDHNALWSSHASGSHWVRFIAEYLTAHPTHGHPDNIGDTPICMNRFPSSNHPLAHVRRSFPFILYKNHSSYPLTEKSTLLLLVRDFRERLGHKNYTKKIAGVTLDYIKLLG